MWLSVQNTPLGFVITTMNVDRGVLFTTKHLTEMLFDLKSPQKGVKLGAKTHLGYENT